LLALLLSGCASHEFQSSAGGCSSGDETSDVKVCQSIRSTLQAKSPGSLSVLSVLCNNQLVVIAGALPPDYKPAVEAVHIATKTPGVRHVETFFVPRVAQDTSDSAIAARIRITLAGDAGRSAAGTDFTVVAGTVVLVGVVDDQAKANWIIANTGSVAGVKGVRSFIQLRQ
jgi:osmotically-inducible protein OsmY